MTDRRCSLDGCERPHHARGVCHTHYEWSRRHGAAPRVIDHSVEGRLLAESERSRDGCLLWTGSLSSGADRGEGYGSIRDADGRNRPVHRVAYETWVGPIPDGWTIDHLCHVIALSEGTCEPGPCAHRRCIEPSHLQPATVRDNLLSGGSLNAIAASKTHCVKGHPLWGDNLAVYPSSPTKRQCRTCDRARSRRQRQRRET